MDLKQILNSSNALLVYPPMLSAQDFVRQFYDTYSEEISVVFSSCKYEDKSGLKKKNVSYSDDIVWFHEMEAPTGWVIVEDFQSWYNSNLRWRISDAYERKSGILFLTTWGIDQVQLEVLRPLQVQLFNYQPIALQNIQWVSMCEPFNSIMLGGVYQGKKIGVLSSAGSQLSQDFSCLEIGIHYWSARDQITKEVKKGIQKWIEQPCGIFMFSTVPPLDLSALDAVYLTGDWTRNDLWLVFNQAYLLVNRMKPLQISVELNTPDQHLAFECFQQENIPKSTLFQSLLQTPQIQYNPEGQNWIALK